MLNQATSILILGLGREGASSYKYLTQRYPQIKLWPYDDSQDSDYDFESPLLTSIAAAQENTYDLVIKSPGIKPTHPLLVWARDQKITITSNTQLFFDELPTLTLPVTVIGVTGTKGKSTTTSVIYEVLKSALADSESGSPQKGRRGAFLGGNIGTPALEIVLQLQQTTLEYATVVLEMSSHQLLDLHTSPHVAVVQNVVPEHLDYYDGFEAYVAAKKHITAFQTTQDYVIFNPEFKLATEIASLSPGTQLTFSSHADQPSQASEDPIASIKDGTIFRQDQAVIKVEELPLLGQHNLENILPAVVVSHIYELSVATVAQALKNFKPLPYRLELVGNVNGVKYYNDSLSTVPEAASSALRAFASQPIILIAGGFDRGLEFQELAETILDPQLQVGALLLFKPTGEKIQQALKKLSPSKLPFTIQFVSDMTDAVTTAAEMAKPGSVVLLSPASPSFGQFKNYADRGDQFTAAVQALPSAS